MSNKEVYEEYKKWNEKFNELVVYTGSLYAKYKHGHNYNIEDWQVDFKTKEIYFEVVEDEEHNSCNEFYTFNIDIFLSLSTEEKIKDYVNHELGLMQEKQKAREAAYLEKTRKDRKNLYEELKKEFGE